MKGAERKACRRDAKAALRQLPPPSPPRADGVMLGADLKRRWFAARCGNCGACPKFMARRGFADLRERPPPVLRIV